MPWQFLGYHDDASALVALEGMSEVYPGPAHSLLWIYAKGPDLYGRKAFIAQITGLDPTYKYRRVFDGKSTGEQVRLVVPRINKPALYQIRATTTGWFCIYPDTECKPQIYQIHESTMKGLLMAAMDPFQKAIAGTKNKTVQDMDAKSAALEAFKQVFMAQQHSSVGKQKHNSAPVIPTPAITVAPPTGKRRILKGI